MDSNLAQLLESDVERILGSDGLLVREGMTHNPKQLEYAKRAASGFCSYQADQQKTALNILEAATGTGKTLGYLVPLFCYAARTGERVMVSTYTRMLQKQILDKDALLAQKWVAEITGVNLSIARRIGLSNYVSPTACAQLIDQLKIDNEIAHEDAITLLEQLMDWAEDQDQEGCFTNSGVLDDFLAEAGLESLPDSIPLGKIMLDRASSPADEFARYEADIERARSVDVQVVNHALVMLHAYRWASILDGADMRPTKVLVCDEADRLSDAAESIMKADLTLHTLNQLAHKTSEILGVKDGLQAIHDLHDYVRHQIAIPDNNIMAVTKDDARSGAMQGLISRANNAARAVVQTINRQHPDLLIAGKQQAELAHFVDAANDLALFAAAMMAADNTALISWSPIKSYPSMRIGRPNPGRILARLWATPDRQDEDVSYPPLEPLKAALFTSATLSVPGKTLPAAFDEFAQSVGIVRHPAKGSVEPIHNALTNLYARFEPSRFGKMRFVLADPRIPNPTLHFEDEEKDRLVATNPEWLSYVSKMVLAAYQQGGRVLVLTLSYPDTSNLAYLLKDHIPESDLIVHKRGQGLSALRKAFMNPDTPNAVLISPGAWEGLDMPGYIKHLVVTRIPFQPLQTSESEILRAHLYSKGMADDKIQSVIRARAVSSARRKLAQGLGRPIRSKDDDATVWIADPRFPLPDAMTQSLDPIMLAAPSRSIQRLMLSCIPSRFIDEYQENAKLCLLDGTLYTPEL